MLLAAERRARLGALQQECLELEEQISRIKSKIKQKKHEIAPLAPVYTLADDVVVIVLRFAYQHHFPHCRLDDGLPHTNSPIAISHVSRWWRRQATSLPSIWTCIHVTPEQPAHYAEVAKAYLVRSRSLPLSISFQCRTPDILLKGSLSQQLDWSMFEGSIWRRFKSSWKYLLTEGHRWKNCSIYLWHQESTQAILFSLNGCKFPHLEYLGISIGAEDAPDLVPNFEAPGLTELRAECWLPVFKAPRRLFSGLTDLKIHDASCAIGALTDVLAVAAGTLERFSLSQVCLEFNSNPPEILLPTLPRLTYLLLEDVVDEHNNEEYRFCPAICRVAVALKALRFTAGSTTDTLCINDTVLPTLRHLSLPYLWRWERTQVRALFRATPTLQTLQAGTVRDISGWFNLAVEMDQSSGSCIAWPNLESLFLSNVRYDQALSAFIRHRAHIGKPLKSLVLGDEYAERLRQDDLDAFHQLQLDFSACLRAPPEVRASLASPMDWWDDIANKPAFAPWKGSFEFHDQFSHLQGRLSPCGSEHLSDDNAITVFEENEIEDW
ncbi:uncharacterized protein PHACADRAFT_253459 [Phanerochaete carnosa HHB-10118-sp]|uniref:F-box domain-containing protein n=1 Tax=Phanerochaete carnosa (strain HHB-10118-sp) TaxID=650164 RepID=K5V1K9_PHACS|nr:uncharacterized protein PHACADRAFT_253459 [Phanerochaete carnosa HHB-10118-sp]EKM56376.1 hypothetical protein PHACADRAFT_253459 [Phanerochaete carnosa HHB-10118-sp]